MSWAWDWLDFRPFDGETTAFDLVASVVSLFLGSLAGGRAVAASRIKAEIRWGLIEAELADVMTLPHKPELCLEWSNRVVSVADKFRLLSWPERCGWAVLYAYLPSSHSLDQEFYDQLRDAEQIDNALSYPELVAYHAIQRNNPVAQIDDGQNFSSLRKAFLMDYDDSAELEGRVWQSIEYRLRRGGLFRRSASLLLSGRLVARRLTSRAPTPHVIGINRRRVNYRSSSDP